MTHETNFPDEETLLDYVACRALPEVAARIETDARRNPDLAAEIALLQAARQALADTTADGPPGALGWARLERELDCAKVTATRRRPTWQVVAASAAAAVLLWQFAVTPMVLPRQGTYIAATAGAQGPAATVAFVPGATELQIRSLLLETDARMTDGPSALGLWRLGFADGNARDAALARMRAASGVVESVQAD